MKQGDQRNQSWEILDLAFKTQFPSRMQAPRILLWFLAKMNKNGASFHGYQSITAHTGLSKDGISTGLKYLRDELHILTWESGGGGPIRKQTNHYRLDLEAMRELVLKQGVFDPATGKLLVHSQSCQTGKTSEVAVSVRAAVVSADSQSTLLEPSVDSAHQAETLSNQHSVSGKQHEINSSSLVENNRKENIDTEYSVPAGSTIPARRVPPDVNNTHDRLGLEQICCDLHWEIFLDESRGIDAREKTMLLKEATAKLKQFKCGHEGCPVTVDYPGDFCLSHYRPNGADSLESAIESGTGVPENYMHSFAEEIPP